MASNLISLQENYQERSSIISSKILNNEIIFQIHYKN